MTQCPNCQSTDLKPSKIENGLPGMSCLKCHGVLVNLLSYRNWLEQGGELLAQSRFSPAKVSPEDTTKALQCPKCEHLMSKFKIESEADNRVDVCLRCDEAWLDDGEWTLLKQLELQEKLATITTEPWQIRVKREKVQEAVIANLKSRVGEADYSKAIELRSWLEQNPNKELLTRIVFNK